MLHQGKKSGQFFCGHAVHSFGVHCVRYYGSTVVLLSYIRQVGLSP